MQGRRARLPSPARSRGRPLGPQGGQRAVPTGGGLSCRRRAPGRPTNAQCPAPTEVPQSGDGGTDGPSPGSGNSWEGLGQTARSTVRLAVRGLWGSRGRGTGCWFWARGLTWHWVPVLDPGPVSCRWLHEALHSLLGPDDGIRRRRPLRSHFTTESTKTQVFKGLVQGHTAAERQDRPQAESWILQEPSVWGSDGGREHERRAEQEAGPSSRCEQAPPGSLPLSLKEPRGHSGGAAFLLHLPPSEAVAPIPSPQRAPAVGRGPWRPVGRQSGLGPCKGACLSVFPSCAPRLWPPNDLGSGWGDPSGRLTRGPARRSRWGWRVDGGPGEGSRPRHTCSGRRARGPAPLPPVT